MGIRSKTLLVLTSLLIATFVGIAVLAQTVLLSGFKRVEQVEMTKNVSRAADAVQQNLHRIHLIVADWAYWGAVYDFIQDHNQAFKDENIYPETFTGQRINFMLYYDTRNRLVEAAGFDIESGEPLEIPDSLKQAITVESKLLGDKDQAGKELILDLPEGPLMLSSRPVYKEGEDGPYGGTIVMAAYFNEAMVKQISETTHLPLAFYSYKSSKLPADVSAYRTAHGQQGAIMVTPVNADTVAGYTVIKDASGQPSLLARVEQPRTIYQQGLQTLQYLVIYVLGLSVGIALIIAFLLDRLVIGPIRRLSQEVAVVPDEAKGYRVFAPHRRDEVSRLALDINGMLGGLEEAHTALEHEKELVEEKVVERTRQLSEAQAELAASVRSLPFGFALINQQDQVIFANSVLNKLVKHTIPLDRAASSKALKAIAAEYAGAIDLLSCIHKAQEQRKPIEQNIEFGTSFFRFIFTPVLAHDDKTERVLGAVMVMEDVTEEKALQRSRDEFFSIASHELRTPLTAIRGNSDMIKDFFKKEMKNADLKGMISDIYSSSVRLIDIVNDFLDMSRLEQGQTAFASHPFNVAELAEETLRDYVLPADRSSLTLKFEPTSGSDKPLWALADKDRVRQILSKLLANAVLATEKGGITVQLQAEGKLLTIAVSDTGKGIPEQLQHLLFHKFQQAAGSILTRDSTHSTGLGLYISRLLAEGMKGKLYLDRSEPGKGSTFVLQLPIAKPAAPIALPDNSTNV